MDQSIKYLDLGWTGLRRGVGTGAAHAVRPPTEPKGPAAGRATALNCALSIARQSAPIEMMYFNELYHFVLTSSI